MEDLIADPARMERREDTGILVRAKLGDRWGAHDIACLTAASLLTWLRSRGGKNPWAENVVGTLLGHESPIATDGGGP